MDHPMARTPPSAPSWATLLLQTAVWGACSGATFFALRRRQRQPQQQQQQQRPPGATPLSPPVGVLTLPTPGRLTPLDWVSVICALFQPRVFVGMVLWQALRPAEAAAAEGALSAPRPRAAEPAGPPPGHPPDGTGAESMPLSPPRARKPHRKRRYLELLVHNVSHADLILGLEPAGTPFAAPATAMDRTVVEEGSFLLCRPRFSRFHQYSLKVHRHLTPSGLLFLPCYQRQFDDPQYSIVLRKNAAGAPDYHQHPPTPTGLHLRRAVPVDPAEVRVRGRDQDRAAAAAAGAGLQTRQVFFPLLACLLPRWRQQIAVKHRGAAGLAAADKEGGGFGANVHRVLVLVSGLGTPRDTAQRPQENSTEVCAELMRHFVTAVDPGITVLHIHSDWNIFRYDENMRFVKEVFMPRIHAYRDAHARGLPYPHEPGGMLVPVAALEEVPFREDWRSSFTTTISGADGSSARMYAIQSGLREYRPYYFHFWQLKTFWHECKIVIDDIEVHSYAAMELIPPVDTEVLSVLPAQEDSTDILRVINEIKAFRSEMQDMLRQENHELSRFWLRKTQKPVLAVLLVRSHNREPVLYRGTNMEVSMPTGSLCAERNVIGTALANNPALKRQDLKVLAVLAVPFEESSVKQQTELPRTTSNASVDQYTGSRKSSIGSEADNYDWQMTHPMWIDHQTGEAPLDSSFTMVPPETTTDNDEEIEEPLARRIDLFSSATTQSTMRTVFLKQSTKQKDLNPLVPCGACNEWLKKIAESNPYFKILTFTDCQCHGVFITPCKDS